MKLKYALTGIALLLISIPTYAAPLPSSSVSEGGTGASLDVGVPEFANSYYFECAGEGTCTSPLIATTTPYTIISYAIISVTGAVDTSVSCDGHQLPFTGLLDFANNTGLSSAVSITNNGPIHCSSNLITSDSVDESGNFANNYVFLQYVPYDTRINQSTTTMPLTDTHFTIIAGVAIAMSSMWLIISLFKKRI